MHNNPLIPKEMLLGFALALVMKDIKAEQRAGPGAGARLICYKQTLKVS